MVAKTMNGVNPVRDRTSEMSDGRLRRPVSNGINLTLA